MPNLLRTTCSAFLLMAAFDATAGCGTAFCSLNTDWSTHGAWTDRGGRFDLRYEFIDQDQPRSGTEEVSVGEIPRHHDEVRTINRNLIAGFDYTFDANWGLAITAPVVSRSHSHIHNHHGAALSEEWNFTRLGDMRLAGRYRFTPESSSPDAGNFGLQFGAKLPTGETNVANADGEVAERSLQPGSGTTDALFGAFYSGTLGAESSWFADLILQAPLDERTEYKPGNRVGLDLGISYPWTARIALLLQLNAQWKDSDSGENAEPEDTGGTFVHLSPGFGIGVGDKTRLYAFVQLPLYQDVNGVQLTADWSLAAGISRSF
jgi:hypothetical protein